MYKLVPLRIPSGWRVVWNDFTEAEPEQFTDARDEIRWEFKEDLMLLEHDRTNKRVDLGWYPEFKVEGEYFLRLVSTNLNLDSHSNHGDVIKEFRSKSRTEIERKIEQFLTT
jgi:hypothetical protein